MRGEMWLAVLSEPAVAPRIAKRSRHADKQERFRMCIHLLNYCSGVQPQQFPNHLSGLAFPFCSFLFLPLGSPSPGGL